MFEIELSNIQHFPSDTGKNFTMQFDTRKKQKKLRRIQNVLYKKFENFHDITKCQMLKC